MGGKTHEFNLKVVTKGRSHKTCMPIAVKPDNNLVKVKFMCKTLVELQNALIPIFKGELVSVVTWCSSE